MIVNCPSLQYKGGGPCRFCFRRIVRMLPPSQPQQVDHIVGAGPYPFGVPCTCTLMHARQDIVQVYMHLADAMMEFSVDSTQRQRYPKVALIRYSGFFVWADPPHKKCAIYTTSIFCTLCCDARRQLRRCLSYCCAPCWH